MCLSSISTEPYYLHENVPSCEVRDVNLHVYYTVNMVVVNYFGTKSPDIEEIDGQIKSADLHVKIPIEHNQKMSSELRCIVIRKLNDSDCK